MAPGPFLAEQLVQKATIMNAGQAIERVQFMKDPVLALQFTQGAVKGRGALNHAAFQLGSRFMFNPGIFFLEQTHAISQRKGEQDHLQCRADLQPVFGDDSTWNNMERLQGIHGHACQQDRE
ncbi:hypothetical protein LCGC14_0034690 [marine sediment metagenome]|uniref:Uncharacterized protein n=1 Tax=marine sediment metagenome TaxID=412755 RepID=A0A0F9YCK8_9ZZZZ